MATRRELADRAAAAYAAEPGVVAVALGGSVSRGEADRFSDIELGVFWNEAPTERGRENAIERADGVVLRLFPYSEEETAWFDDWLVDGVVVEPVHMTTAAMDRLLDAVLRAHDPDPRKQVVIAAIVNGITLHGDDVIAPWREDAAVFPDELARAVVQANAQIGNFWHLEMARVRDNPFLVYRKIVDVHERMLRVLLAINRVYWYGFKSLDGIGRRLSIAPENLVARIRAGYRADANAESDLAALVEETYDLVERHVPGVDVDRLRRVFHHRHEPRDD